MVVVSTPGSGAILAPLCGPFVIRDSKIIKLLVETFFVECD